MASAEGLADWLVEISGSAVVVDLSDLTFMDSSGIAQLIQAKHELEQRQDSLILTRPQPNVLRVFEVTGLTEWISEWDDGWAIQKPAAEDALSQSDRNNPAQDRRQLLRSPEGRCRDAQDGQPSGRTTL